MGVKRSNIWFWLVSDSVLDSSMANFLKGGIGVGKSGTGGGGKGPKGNDKNWEKTRCVNRVFFV